MRAPPLIEGRRADGRGGGSAGECTYWVAEAAKGDKRAAPRKRTRLRTGKIVDPDGRFVTECLIYDRSEAGGRLRLPSGIALTRWVQLYEDQSATLFQGEVVWRLDRDAGLRFRPFQPTARTRALEADMRRRFYAVRG